MTSLARPPAGSRTARHLILILVALIAVAGLECAMRGDEGVPALPASEARGLITGEAADYGQKLRRLDLAIRISAADAAERPGEWLFEEALARAYMARARLSGDYEDYARAQAAFDRAFAAAPAGSGPHLAAAMLNFSLHRLDQAQVMLDRIENYAVPPMGGDLAELLGMRGDIAFYRGDYAEALRHYQAADRIEPGAADFRQAVFHARTGRIDLAERHFDSYERSRVRPDRYMRANMALQRGILDLDSGRWEEALAHFRAADALLPGWWLVEEHIAEVTALLGDSAGAELLYRSVVRRTGSPEFMDALAALLRARGADAEADELSRRAAASWERRLQMFPEATYGHAIEHCLSLGRSGCALRLAQRNFAARPYGEAGVQLASALAVAGRVSEARAVIDRVLASAWRTPDTYRTAYRIYQAQADPAARQLAAEARRLNPRIDLHSGGGAPGASRAIR